MTDALRAEVERLEKLLAEMIARGDQHLARAEAAEARLATSNDFNAHAHRVLNDAGVPSETTAKPFESLYLHQRVEILVARLASADALVEQMKDQIAGLEMGESFRKAAEQLRCALDAERNNALDARQRPGAGWRPCAFPISNQRELKPLPQSAASLGSAFRCWTGL